MEGLKAPSPDAAGLEQAAADAADPGAAAARGAEGDAEAEARERRLQALMGRINEQPDFAGLKESMLGIQRVSRSDRAHVRALTDLIHDDAAMVGKLLRLINAAYYSSVGGGQITSMARAVSLMGFKSIGLLASSLMLFEKLPKGQDGARLRREFARAQFAALLAHDLCHSRDHVEHIYIAALFQRLGDMLAGWHFQTDARLIEDQLDDRELAAGSPERALAREQLARAQWGLTIEEIGIEMARQWGWPAPLLVTMHSLKPEDPELELDGDAYVRVLCTECNRLAEDLMRLPQRGNAEERAEARAAMVGRFVAQVGVPLRLPAEGLPEVVEGTVQQWFELLKALGLSLDEVLGEVDAPEAAAKPVKKVDPTSREYRQKLAEDLADAVDHLSRLNRRGAARNEVVNLGLKLMQKALDLQRVIICLRDPDGTALKGRLGLGDKAAVLTPYFEIGLQPPACLFGLLCAKNADTHIRDASDPVIAQRLPAWFGRRVKAGAFVVLPLVSNHQVLGMLYGDQREPNQMLLHDRALTLLKNLRNEVLLAMQADRG